MATLTLGAKFGHIMDNFEHTRRFFCRALPIELDDWDSPTLIIQSYYVHDGGYALRVRLKTRNVRLAMTPDLQPLEILQRYQDDFRSGSISVKGPSVGGTRYEASRDIDARIAAELIKRGGEVTIKNRFTDWIEEDGWNIDVFGGANAPLIIAEAERIGPVINLAIPKFCVTEITDQARFSNEGLAANPYSAWRADFERELETDGPRFLDYFGVNRME